MNKELRIIKEFSDIYNKMVLLNSLRMKEHFKGYKSSEIHCIEYIGNNKDVNVTKLSEVFYMTRSAMSKITKKLMEKGIIESYQKGNNKKEIYFKLTAKGEEINRVHEEIHRGFQERDKPVMEQFTEEQFNIMFDFVEKYGKHLDREIEKENAGLKNSAIE